MLLTLSEMGEESIHSVGTNGYHEKLEKQRHTSLEPQIWNFHVFIWQIDKLSGLSVTNLMLRFFLMTAHTREFPMIHKIIDIDETDDVTTSSNLDMVTSMWRSLWINHCKKAFLAKNVQLTSADTSVCLIVAIKLTLAIFTY